MEVATVNQTPSAVINFNVADEDLSFLPADARQAMEQTISLQRRENVAAIRKVTANDVTAAKAKKEDCRVFRAILQEMTTRAQKKGSTDSAVRDVSFAVQFPVDDRKWSPGDPIVVTPEVSLSTGMGTEDQIKGLYKGDNPAQYWPYRMYVLFYRMSMQKKAIMENGALSAAEKQQQLNDVPKLLKANAIFNDGKTIPQAYRNACKLCNIPNSAAAPEKKTEAKGRPPMPTGDSKEMAELERICESDPITIRAVCEAFYLRQMHFVPYVMMPGSVERGKYPEKVKPRHEYMAVANVFVSRGVLISPRLTFKGNDFDNNAANNMAKLFDVNAFWKFTNEGWTLLSTIPEHLIGPMSLNYGHYSHSLDPGALDEAVRVSLPLNTTVQHFMTSVSKKFMDLCPKNSHLEVLEFRSKMPPIIGLELGAWAKVFDVNTKKNVTLDKNSNQKADYLGLDHFMYGIRVLNGPTICSAPDDPKCVELNTNIQYLFAKTIFSEHVFLKFGFLWRDTECSRFVEPFLRASNGVFTGEFVPTYPDNDYQKGLVGNCDQAYSTYIGEKNKGAPMAIAQGWATLKRKLEMAHAGYPLETAKQLGVYRLPESPYRAQLISDYQKLVGMFAVFANQKWTMNKIDSVYVDLLQTIKTIGWPVSRESVKFLLPSMKKCGTRSTLQQNILLLNAQLTDELIDGATAEVLEKEVLKNVSDEYDFYVIGLEAEIVRRQLTIDATNKILRPEYLQTWQMNQDQEQAAEVRAAYLGAAYKSLANISFEDGAITNHFLLYAVPKTQNQEQISAAVTKWLNLQRWQSPQTQGIKRKRTDKPDAAVEPARGEEAPKPTTAGPNQTTIPEMMQKNTAAAAEKPAVQVEVITTEPPAKRSKHAEPVAEDLSDTESAPPIVAEIDHVGVDIPDDGENPFA